MAGSWFVAPSYKYAKIVKVDESARKAFIEEKCDRCGGTGIWAREIRNGAPYGGGVCYKCDGAGVVAKWVKAYTEEEYEKYMAAQERARERRQEAARLREQEKINKSEENRKALLAQWGYDPENPQIWLIGGGDTFAIKEEIKAAGGHFCRELGWYTAQPIDVPVGYGQVAINFNDVYDWECQSRRFNIKEDAKEIADAAVSTLYPKSNSEWIGDIKERVRGLKVTLTGSREIDGYYGSSTVFTFKNQDNIIIWITASCPDIETGKEYLLTGTVKSHDQYKGVKQTKMSRCIIKEVA